MADDQNRNEPEAKGRRFRLGRKVKTPPATPDTQAERDLKEVEPEEEALRGSPEFEAFTRRGCGGCVNLTVLIFVIMMASIIGTCVIRR
jgi:hypothetical protein